MSKSNRLPALILSLALLVIVFSVVPGAAQEIQPEYLVVNGAKIPAFFPSSPWDAFDPIYLSYASPDLPIAVQDIDTYFDSRCDDIAVTEIVTSNLSITMRESLDPVELGNALACTPTINYPDFSSTAGLNLVGDTETFADRLRLTPALDDQTGAAWYTTKQFIQEGFETLFQFQVAIAQGTGANGFAFVIQNNSVSALGNITHGIGYEGITNSLAVEFDTWFNSDDNVRDDNHIGVQTCGIEPNSAGHGCSLVSTTLPIDISDGSVHTVTIKYVTDTMRIFLDNPTTPVLTATVDDLATILSLDNGRAWIGFTAGTGVDGIFESWESHDILSWSFCHSVCDPASITAMTSDSPVELGNAMNFTASVTGTQPITYAWDFGGAGTRGGTDANPTYTYDTACAYTVTLVVTNACGTDSDFITVTVSGGMDLYVQSVVTSVGAIAVHTFIVTNTGITTNTLTFTYTDNTWTVYFSPTNVITVPAGSTGMMDMVVEFPPTATAYATHTVTIIVTPQTGAPVAVVLTSNTGCRFDFVENGIVDTNDVSDIIGRYGKNDPYYDVADHNGVVNMIDISLVIGRFGVLCHPPACNPVSITALMSDSPVTLGEAIHFTATVTGTQPITYTWDFDDDGTPEQSGVGLDTISHTFVSAGSYTVTLNVENGCPSTATDFITVAMGGGMEIYVQSVVTSVGAIAVHTFIVTNTGITTNTLTFTYTDNTWDVYFSPVDVITVPAGLTGTVDLTVKFPYTATAYVTHTVTVTVTPQTGAPVAVVLTSNTGCRFNFAPDGIIDFDDALIVADLYGTLDDPFHDLDHSGVIDHDDTLLVIDRFGALCP